MTEELTPSSEVPRVQPAVAIARYALWKASADAVTAWLSISTQFSIMVVLAIIVFAPELVPLLHRFSIKSSEINILGSKIQIVDVALTSAAVKLTDDGKLLIGGMDANEVPDRIAQLVQTGQNLKAENDGLKSSVQDLQALVQTTKAQLDEANAKLKGMASAPVPTDDLNAKIERTTADANIQLEAATTASDQAAKIIHDPDVAAAVGFGVVFGADASPEAAMDEVRKAKVATSNPIILFKRLGLWRSVAFFGTQPAAVGALGALKKKFADAYFVDISKWCPTPRRISAETDSMAQQKDCDF